MNPDGRYETPEQFLEDDQAFHTCHKEQYESPKIKTPFSFYELNYSRYHTHKKKEEKKRKECKWRKDGTTERKKERKKEKEKISRKVLQIIESRENGVEPNRHRSPRLKREHVAISITYLSKCTSNINESRWASSRMQMARISSCFRRNDAKHIRI